MAEDAFKIGRSSMQRIAAAVRRVEAMPPPPGRRTARFSGPGRARAGGSSIPTPTAADQFLISKADPDNPGSFIWEAADGRWGS